MVFLCHGVKTHRLQCVLGFNWDFMGYVMWYTIINVIVASRDSRMGDRIIADNPIGSKLDEHKWHVIPYVTKYTHYIYIYMYTYIYTYTYMVQNWWPDDIFDYHVVIIASSASDDFRSYPHWSVINTWPFPILPLAMIVPRHIDKKNLFTFVCYN